MNEQHSAGSTDSLPECSHTPGQWKVDGLTIESVHKGNICLLNLSRPKTETDANARLIAAAPDLLQSARKAVSLLLSYSDSGNILDELERAIAKAEGRA